MSCCSSFNTTASDLTHQRWQDYRNYYDPKIASTAHRCLFLWARFKIGDKTALEAVNNLWNVGKSQPSACDLMDRRLLSLAREADDRFAQLIPPAAEAALLVEMTGFGPMQVKARVRMAIDAVRTVDSAAHDSRFLFSQHDLVDNTHRTHVAFWAPRRRMW